MDLQIYNSLSRKKTVFSPLDPAKVRMYTCGPTVYDYAHIGNFRTYILSDLVRRTLSYLGYQVKAVMNITDVGHLTSDADQGEDKLEKGAKREGKTAWQIAKKYTRIFEEDMLKLKILKPDLMPKATEHIEEQIELVKQLEEKSYTYQTADGLYFDTSKLADYGRLARLEAKELQAGARVEENPEKRQPADFALWKFSPRDKQRDMEWDSPWGKGFPGWHLECSAMSAKYLGVPFDLHLGGIDLRPIHHTNELAQTKAATGKQLANYWIHGEFILVEGEKMSKSKGNFLNLNDLQKKGFEPLALRYLYLTGHYRKPLNFTWQALESSQTALNKLREMSAEKKQELPKKDLETGRALRGYNRRFIEAIADDFNMPEALAVAWEVLKSGLPPGHKGALLKDWDEVFGLNLGRKPAQADIPEEIKQLASLRESLRAAKKWAEADRIRGEIEEKGYRVQDTAKGWKIKQKQ